MSRTQTWKLFEKRFTIIDSPEGSSLWNELPADHDPAYWWTIVEGSRGRLYATPGLHWVNRVGYLHTKQPWGAVDVSRPDYKYL